MLVSGQLSQRVILLFPGRGDGNTNVMEPFQEVLVLSRILGKIA
jgi:hypothetical protein